MHAVKLQQQDVIGLVVIVAQLQVMKNVQFQV
jgi:hypothetical protein